jgi:hypothetical protein
MIRRLRDTTLVAWGDNTPQTWASVQGDGHIRLPTLERLRRGLTTWL